MPTDHPTPDASKPVRKSKTMWINGLTLAAALLAGPLGIALPPQWAVPALAGVNLALRWITRGPVHLLD